MDENRLTVGELAGRTGLTVRTLHHWDELGLLAPAERTGAGYRLYGESEVERVYRITALRSLGLELSQIRELLDGGADLGALG
jgi:DNA-binding transcriptional MerR regulator